ncbi:MAG: SHOCT domain-containing protein, partial [Acidimicrobiia bacterium]|nr:SHOCT domain-containing protein [Acidimicrobiia bacterium]
RKPREVQQEIYRAMEADERSRFEAMGQAASGARDPQPASIAEQIAQFDELRQRGLLTDEEFESKKRDLLG